MIIVTTLVPNARNGQQRQRFSPALAAICLLTVLLTVGFTRAQSESFAALEIEPLPGGEAVYDADTGYTTLSNGGVVRDRDSALTITGDFIRYQEETFVQVSGATAEGEFGSLETSELYFDRVADTIRGSQGASFNTENLTLSGEEFFIYLSENVALLQGEVAGTSPEFSSTALVVDVDLEEALLVGPYRYQDGAVTLSSDRAGDLLAFEWDSTEESVDFQVRSVVPAQLRTRLEPYIP